MPLDRERELLARHADAVIDHREEAAPAFLQDDGDAMGAGVDRVLDQLLDRAGRTLDHLARGDAVDQVGGQTA